jgi:alpha-glucuronidase
MLRAVLRPIGMMLALLACAPAQADDGYRLWLGYRPAPGNHPVDVMPVSRPVLPPAAILREGRDPTVDLAARELHVGLRAMQGRPVPIRTDLSAGAILIGTPLSSPRIAGLGLPLRDVGPEGYVIRTLAIDGRAVTVIAGNASIGVLYGAFHYLRMVQTGQSVDRLSITEQPRIKLRMLNHWDNLDRHVERGYSGQSIWDWWRLPDLTDQRYVDYARANASVGINATVLNNVNAKSDSLTGPYIAKAAKLADIFRPYGIRVFLSARWTAPVELGGLKSADPLDPAVVAWWKAKSDEIYRAIPDFGGFLVKANSEGQPGPQDSGRTHADGANMLAAALRPHGGTVLWRAFVYSQVNPEDRAKQAYSEFKPLDGRFTDNVVVQVKNGPIDFQPREPFHPLFGAMKRTPLAIEFQITKEYLGFATHLAYLAPLYEEVLDADTGHGATVAEVIARPRVSVMAGVANIGTDRNWSGSIFDQANWYAFGRLAWNPAQSSRQIAAEWVAQTISTDSYIVTQVTGMMMRSRQAVVDYMTPLGLSHLMATGHHYGPGPWVSDLDRPEWNPVYYHRADKTGIGFDRTAAGSNAVAQYAPSVARRFADRQSVPDDLLLWFHHVGWDERMRSGVTLWEELVSRYDRGVATVAAMEDEWLRLTTMLGSDLATSVAQNLVIQRREAKWWRDASLAYWMNVSGRSLPAGVTPPEHDLEYYKKISFPYAPGN